MPRHSFHDDDLESDDSIEPELDESDDDDTDTCPRCGQVVSILIDHCPHCGQWITDDPPRRGIPYLFLAIAAIIGLLVAWRCFS